MQVSLTQGSKDKEQVLREVGMKAARTASAHRIVVQLSHVWEQHLKSALWLGHGIQGAEHSEAQDFFFYFFF